jgi:hypothetical protein
MTPTLRSSGTDVNIQSTLGWKLTSHARDACSRRGISKAEALMVAYDPEIAYDQTDYGGGRQMRQRGDLAVVTVPGLQLIITVLSRQEQDWADDEVRQGRRTLVSI